MVHAVLLILHLPTTRMKGGSSNAKMIWSETTGQTPGRMRLIYENGTRSGYKASTKLRVKMKLKVRQRLGNHQSSLRASSSALAAKRFGLLNHDLPKGIRTIVIFLSG